MSTPRPPTTGPAPPRAQKFVNTPGLVAELSDCGGHVLELTVGQFGIEREGQHLPACPFRAREVALRVLEVPVGRLPMHRRGIVHARSDATLLEVLPQGVPSRGPDHV